MLFPLFDHNPHRRIPWLTLAIILANIVVMFLLQRAEPIDQFEAVYRFGFIPKRISQLETGQPLLLVEPEEVRGIRVLGQPRARPFRITLPADPAPIYMTLFTMMFLHGGWFHLASNMWMLWVFGNNIEDRLGHVVYLFFYLLGGLIAILCQWATDPMSDTPVIGASGAVAAVLGAYALTYPHAKVRTLIFFGLVMIMDLPALLVLGGWFVLQLVSAFNLPQGILESPVAFWAHIGGFVAGLVLMPLMAIGAPPPDTDWREEADEMFRFDSPRDDRPPREDRPRREGDL